jgi:hypothetical protein
VKSAGAKQAAEKLRSRASKLGSGEQGLKALIQSVELIGPAEAVPLLQSPSARVFPQPVKPKSFIWRLFGTTEVVPCYKTLVRARFVSSLRSLKDPQVVDKGSGGA